ncbi:MAG: tetratricopeptide repeat protein [Bdellovibrionales bacterium]
MKKNFSFKIFLLLCAFSLSAAGVQAEKRKKSSKPAGRPSGQTSKKTKVALSDNELMERGYKFLQSGTPLLAAEELLKVENPSRVSLSAIQDLKKLAPATSAVWKLVQTPMSSAWAKKLGSDISAVVRVHQLSHIETAEQKKQVKQSLGSLKKNSEESILAQYNLALYEGRNNQLMSAFRRFELLKNMDQTVVDQDLIHLNIARLYFEQGDFESSKRTYDLIPKGSDYWLEALEEKAWAEFREKDYDRAESLLYSVLSPVFDGIVGSEPYFVSGYAKLKVCDYPGIFKTIHAFKSKFQKRLDHLSQLSEGIRTESAQQILTKMSSGTIDYKELGIHAVSLPRMIHRNTHLAKLMMNRSMISTELTKLKNQKTAQLASLEAEKAQGRGFDYLKKLAQNELDEAGKIINKLHILEAEAVQRMHINNKIADRDLKKMEVAGDELEFPVSDEVWVDELDNYHVSTRGCPQIEKKGSRTGSLLSGEKKL